MQSILTAFNLLPLSHSLLLGFLMLKLCNENCSKIWGTTICGYVCSCQPFWMLFFSVTVLNLTVRSHVISNTAWIVYLAVLFLRWEITVTSESYHQLSGFNDVNYYVARSTLGKFHFEIWEKTIMDWTSHFALSSRWQTTRTTFIPKWSCHLTHIILLQKLGKSDNYPSYKLK